MEELSKEIESNPEEKSKKIKISTNYIRNKTSTK